MELKLYHKHTILTVFSCINRTFMELKHNWEAKGDSGYNVSIEPLWNWNSLALPRGEKGRRVSIEPLWNWNQETIRNEKIIIMYQSNLYGIETFYDTSKQRRKAQYQSNLYGIETCSVDSVSITACAYQSNLYGIETRLLMICV